MFTLFIVFLTLVVLNLYLNQLRRDKLEDFKRKDIDKDNDLT